MFPTGATVIQGVVDDSDSAALSSAGEDLRGLSAEQALALGVMPTSLKIGGFNAQDLLRQLPLRSRSI